MCIAAQLSVVRIAENRLKLKKYDPTGRMARISHYNIVFGIKEGEAVASLFCLSVSSHPDAAMLGFLFVLANGDFFDLADKIIGVDDNAA